MKKIEIDGVGEFGKWLAWMMEENNYTIGTLAAKLFLDRRTVEGHVKNLNKVSYLTVLGYCKFFHYRNTREVWNYVMEDRRVHGV